jgi:hypothetical protein
MRKGFPVIRKKFDKVIKRENENEKWERKRPDRM